MNNRPTTNQGAPTLRTLYPQLTEAALEEAAEALDRYALLAFRIYERIRNEPVSYKRFLALTGRDQRSTIGIKESQPA